MWSPQLYIDKGLAEGHSKCLLETASDQIDFVKEDYDLPGLLSLNHLAIRSNTPYLFLREVVARQRPDSYKKFSIKKRSGGRRFIHVPSPNLMTVQRWISQNILSNVKPHRSSYAFTPGGSIVKCAAKHSGAQWLIKMDIMGFFESISEIQVFRVFRGLGYQPLVAFELARIATVPVISVLSPRTRDAVWKVNKENEKIYCYNQPILGYLPQGAPTSPMVSNLALRKVDDEIFSLSKEFGLVYTRYSDDLTFSTRSKKFGRRKARDFISRVGRILAKNGFRPQHRKTTVLPPGSRKIVLGLQVNEGRPSLNPAYS